MSITYRKYQDINDFQRILTFLEGTYETYGTRFDNNITLFEFQTALSRGLAEPVKSIDEALKDVLLWFNGEQLVGLLEEDAFCLAPGYRYIFKDMVVAGEQQSIDGCGYRVWEVYENDSDFEEFLVNMEYVKSEEYWIRRDFEFSGTVTPEIPLPSDFFIRSVPELNNPIQVYKAYKLCYGLEFNEEIFNRMYETSTYRPSWI
ncbi:hypothetical protein [Bacillus sp. P14.5]|uniref:hypothetical protein n=1 Tax=Bacillus sp. P14.5 TaxID=1983400 RepID=UPI000DE8150A|nr:hypothetical protein [Bacillus sp. P14.5]